MAGLRATLVEREQELGLLDAALASAFSGEGRTVIIEGPPGVGKSRLLAAARDLAAAAGRPLWRASGGPLETAFAFGVALQLFEAEVHGLEPGERELAFSGAAALAEPLFEDPTSERGQHAAIHGLYWLAVRLAMRAGGALVAVDDAHWSDPASLRFLSYVARRLEGTPLALVVVGRESPDDPDVASLLSELRSQSGAAVIRPEPLSEGGVAAVVRDRLGAQAVPEFCVACGQVTGGNPFLLHELLIEIEADGVKPTAEEAGKLEQLAPESVLRAVVARLARLPRGSGDLIRAAAVLGSDASLARCATLGGLDAHSAARTADALVAAGILSRSDPPTFEHHLIRSAVDREIPSAQRRRMHLEAAQLLRAQSAGIEQVTPHLLAGARGGGEQWVVDTLLAAARRSLRLGEPHGAVSLLRRALDEPPPREREPELLAELARAQAAAADPDALQTIEHALHGAAASADRVSLYRLLGGTLLARGDHRAAIEAYDRGLVEAVHDEHATRELQAARAVARTLEAGGVPEALAHAETVIAAPGETPGERALLANAAVIKTLSGAPRDDVRPLIERAWSDGALLSDEGPEGHLWSLLTAALTWNDWHADSAAIARAVLDEARQQGALLAVATANYVLGGPDYRRGRIADAIAELETALDSRADGWGAYAGAAGSLLALCLIEGGDVERASETVPDPDDPRWAGTLQEPLVLEGRAAVELATGRNEQALHDYAMLGELAERQHAAANPVVLPWHSGAALAAIRLGDPDRARELIDLGLELALRVGAPSGVARLRWIEGLLLGGSPGLDAMHEAVDMLESSEPTLEHLRALVELGAALRRANRRAEARRPLERARELATLGGATGLAARAADELRATGARPRRIVLSGVQSLTGSELRIAHLAAAGRSNRQIAEELFVTIKAVEFHLGNTYRKLGIQGRRELATALSGDQESTSFVAQ